MGEVWRAHDTVTDRVVAIKVLPAKLSQDEEFQRRFRREAHAAARLETPHVVPIYDYGEIDGRLFVSMRLIKGRDLATVLADGPLEPPRAVRIIGQVAEALHAAHEIGLIHRDIKPSNILLDDRDFAYLIDFGIARSADDTRMTKTGNTIGTFAYIAPERLDLQGEEDARVDIYSLACVLYECLTGETPFAADTMPRLVVAHMSSPPPRPSITRPGVPASVDEVIATGMAKDPNQRYATTIELSDAARDAVTAPVPQPAPTPETTTQQAHNVVTPQPMGSWPAAPAPAPWAPPPQHAPPIPAKRGRMSRRTIALVVGAVALVGVIAVAVAIPALSKHGPSQSSPTSSKRSYGAQVVLPFTGLNYPVGVAVDSTGTAYVTDFENDRVLKLAAGSSTQEVLPFTGLNLPDSVAADSTGTLYVVDMGNNRVLKLPAGSSTQEVLPFTGLHSPDGVAVDNAGTLYVADTHNNRVLKLAAGSKTQQVVPFASLNLPTGVAVDNTGTLYVVDVRNNDNRVLKLAVGSNTQQVLPFTGLTEPHGVAVDDTGTLYVTDFGTERVLKLAAGSNTQEVLPFTDLKEPHGVAVDSTGAVYVAEQANKWVVKLPVQ